MNVTPSEVITSLEKALNAAAELNPGHSPAFIQSQVYRRLENACNPLAIRTLLDAHASALKDAARWKAEFEKRLRVSIMQGDVIANHVIAMQSAVLEQHYGEGSIEAMTWIKNTLAGPGFMPSVEEAEVIPDPDAEGIAQAWFNAKTAEHEAFRAANPGPAALDDNTKGAE